MANDVFMTIRDCVSYVRSRGAVQRFQEFMKLFPVRGPLEFIAMDIIGPLKKTSRVFVFIMEINDNPIRMTRNLSLKKL